MTGNQIKAAQAREEQRANKERENLERSKQKETERSNRATERIKRAGVITQGVTSLGKAAIDAGKILNDPSWYSKDPQLLKDVASFPYGKPLGVGDSRAINYQNGSNGTSKSAKGRGVPGAMILRFIPTIGTSDNYQSDTANILARQIYSYIRHANSGSANYDSPDLLMYLLAMDSIYMFHGEMCRLYSLVRTAKGENRYYPEAIVKAMGYDFDDLLSNLAQLRAFVNVFAIRANALYVPKTWTYYVRHNWMVSSIFKDYPIKRSSEYLFTADAYMRFNNGVGKDMENGSNLTFARLTNAEPMTTVGFQAIKDFGNSLINALLTEEDIGIMAGDILKAFGGDNLFDLKQIDEEYHVEAEYSAEVLSQICSATLNGSFDSSRYYGIHQTKDGFIFQGTTTSSSTGDIVAEIGAMFNNLRFIGEDKTWPIQMYKDDVTPIDTMVASRLSSVRKVGSTGNLKVLGCASELLTIGTIVAYNVDTSSFDTMNVWDGKMVFDISIESLTLADIETKALEAYNTVAALACLDWAPQVRLYARYLKSPNALVIPMYTNADFCNYYNINQADLEAMNSIAMYSLFGVSELTGKVQATKKY